MQEQDGRENIDSLLDQACDRLAEVSVKMHDYWVRAAEERLAKQEQTERLEHSRRTAKVRRVERGRIDLATTLNRLKQEDPAAFQRLIMDAMGDEVQRVTGREMEGIGFPDEEEAPPDPTEE